MNTLRLFAVCVLLTLCSCRKDWYCSCQTVKGDKVAVIIKAAKQKEAMEVCTLRADEPIGGQAVVSCRLQGKYKEEKGKW